MKVLTAPSGTTLHEDVQIQSSFAKLGFSITTSDGLSSLDSIKVKAVKTGKSQETILPEMSLSDLLEIHAIKEGSIRKIELDSETSLITGTIDIGTDGAVSCDNNEYVSFTLRKASADVIDVFAIDFAIASDQFYFHDVIPIIGGGRKEIPVMNASSFAFKKGKVASVQIEYSNGKSVIYTEQELLMIQQDVNDLTLGSNTASEVKFNFWTMVVTELQGATRLFVEAAVDTTFNFYVLREKNFKNGK